MNDGPDDGGIDLSSIVVEVPLSELARLLPQRLAVRLYNLVRKLFEIPTDPCFPCPLADVVRNRFLLSALRAKLAHVDNLSELIANPRAILTNRDAFTGKLISNEILDSAAQIAGKCLEYSLRELAPSMAPGCLR